MEKFGSQTPRFYPLPDGTEVPSVTTVLSLLAKPNLIPWACKCTAEEVIKYVEGERDYALNHNDVIDAVNRAKTAYKRISKDACDVGTAIHDLALMFWENKRFGVPDNKQIQNGFKAFLKWTQDHNVEPVLCEKLVYGDGYAGRYDLLARIDGVLTLVDLKSSKDFHNEMPLQLAAYVNAENDDPAIGIERVEHCGILRLDKETGEPHYRDHSDDLQTNIKAFLLLVEFWKLKNTGDKKNADVERSEKE